MINEKRTFFFQNYSFSWDEISLVSRSVGKILVEDLKEDLRSSPYSLTIDNSTVAKKNITALKVKYLKERVDEEGFTKNVLQNKIIAIKYLKESSNAKTMLQIIDEKIFGLDEKIKSNLVGFVHDHASVLNGETNGLVALLRKSLDQKFMNLNDFCHSLNLAVDKSLDTLPEELMDFIYDIHNHFIRTQRIAYLNRLQIEKGFKVLSLKHYVKTRWLSL